MLLDLVHLGPDQSALRIVRKAIGRRVAGLEIRHRSDSACREQPAFSSNSGSHWRRLPAASLPAHYQRECSTGPDPFKRVRN